LAKLEKGKDGQSREHLTYIKKTGALKDAKENNETLKNLSSIQILQSK